ncbi:MAG: hypothetical protein HY927_13615 [Elusimicrobia bacterium]|nr:hypothetical protein [Elusimicrobiota bacterium]
MEPDRHQDACDNDPSTSEAARLGRERRTLRLAALGAGLLVLMPLLSVAVSRWSARRSAAAARPPKIDFLKKPPAPAPPVAPAAPAAPLTAAPAPPPAPQTPPRLPAAPAREDAGTRRIIKVMQVQFPQPQDEPPAPKYPKLRPSKGWATTDVKSTQNPGTQAGQGPVYYLAPQQTKPSAAPAAIAGPPAPQAAAPTQEQAAPAQPAVKRRPRPTAGTQHVEPAAGTMAPAPLMPRTTVSPGGPTGIMEHLPGSQQAPPVSDGEGHRVLTGPPDTLPPPNPEYLRPDGTCARTGWWLNSSTRLCYFGRDSCEKALPKGTCTQQR